MQSQQPQLSKFSSVIILGLALAALSATQVAQADLRILGTGAYMSQTSDKEEGDTSSDSDRTGTGYHLQALGQYDIISPIPGFAIFGGVGLGRRSLSKEQSSETTIGTVKAVFTISTTILTGEVGAQFSAIPILTLQGALGYDYGLSGETKAEITIPAAGKTTTTTDLSTYWDARLTGRALLTVFPLVRAGLEMSYIPTGKLKAKDSTTKETGFSGYNIGVVAGVSL